MDFGGGGFWKVVVGWCWFWRLAWLMLEAGCEVLVGSYVSEVLCRRGQYMDAWDTRYGMLGYG